MLIAGLLIISGLFILGLFARHFIDRRFCVICASISLTWLSLLALYLFGQRSDPLLLGILIGQSISGLYYFMERKLPKTLKIFSLPYFLSMTGGAYMLLSKRLYLVAFGVMLAVWLAAWLIFTYKNDAGKKNLANSLMECCD